MTTFLARMRRTSATALAATLVPLVLAGCAGGSSRPGDTAYVARDVESLYAAAKDRLDRNQFALAAGFLLPLIHGARWCNVFTNTYRRNALCRDP